MKTRADLIARLEADMRRWASMIEDFELDGDMTPQWRKHLEQSRAEASATIEKLREKERRQACKPKRMNRPPSR